MCIGGSELRAVTLYVPSFSVIFEELEPLANTGFLDSACWERNAKVANESVLLEVLNKGGYNGSDLIKKAAAPAIKDKLRELTAEAKAAGICGVPSYRVFKQTETGNWGARGGVVWGQDETNVVEDLIAGWDDEQSELVAEAGKAEYGAAKTNARL